MVPRKQKAISFQWKKLMKASDPAPYKGCIIFLFTLYQLCCLGLVNYRKKMEDGRVYMWLLVRRGMLQIATGKSRAVLMTLSQVQLLILLCGDVQLYTRHDSVLIASGDDVLFKFTPTSDILWTRQSIYLLLPGCALVLVSYLTQVANCLWEYVQHCSRADYSSLSHTQLWIYNENQHYHLPLLIKPKDSLLLQKRVPLLWSCLYFSTLLIHWKCVNMKVADTVFSAHAHFCFFSGRATQRLGVMMVFVTQILLLMAGDVEPNPGPARSLGLEDLRDVLNAIQQVKQKWYHIGVQLKIPCGTLDSIEQEHPKNTTDCLLKMLQQWLSNTSPPPTWNDLFQALSTSAVGEKRLAEDIKKKHCYQDEQEATDQVSDASLTSHPVRTLSSSSLERYMSYLKEVYRSDSFPTYDKWPQVEGKKFINLSLLSKKKVSPQEAHKYTKAMFHGHINSIAPGKKMEMADIAKTEDGSIIKGKRRCILVDGAPGVGKSTFAWKLCRKWSKGKILHQYKLVVLLRLREKTVREIKKSSHLFRRCHPEAIEEICQGGGEGVLLVLDGWDELPAELYGKESFFLDLVQGQELPDATVVVTSRPHASEVIITKCQDRIFQHIEIMGFSEDNVLMYIQRNSGDDAKLLHDLQTYTSCYPHITSLMYNPLNAAIVVEVYKNSWNEESTIPKTMTELYSSLIRTLLLRYLKEHPVQCSMKEIRRLRQFSDLPPKVHAQLRQVSREAYEGISNAQQVIFSDLPDDFDSLGLMQCVPELYVDEGAALSYNFLHLTVQEFLAAFHLSQLSTAEQMEIFKLHQNDSKYKMVLKFFAGLTSFRGFGDEYLLSILTEKGRESSGVHIKLDFLLFLFEGKESMKALSNALEICFDSSTALSQFDCYVLGYMASHTGCKWSICVQLPIRAPHYVVEMFTRGTKEVSLRHPSKANTVNLTFYNSLDATSGLRELLKAHPLFLNRIVYLDLRNNALDSHSGGFLSLSLTSLPLLHSLDLSLNAIGSMAVEEEGDPSSPTSCSTSTTSSDDNEGRSKGHTLSFCRCTSEQDLSPLKTFLPSHSHSFPSLLHLQSMELLIKALQSCKILKCLKLYDTEIGQPECSALAQWLLSPTCSLEVLNIGGNNLTSEGTELIITALSKNCTLREFDISNSEINSQLLTNMFHLPLNTLHLMECCIGPKEASKIAKILNSNATLEELHLSGNPIGDRGATAMAQMLECNYVLKYFALQNTSLTAQGTQVLLQSLQCNETLSTLLLSNIQSLNKHTDRVVWL